MLPGAFPGAMDGTTSFTYLWRSFTAQQWTASLLWLPHCSVGGKGKKGMFYGHIPGMGWPMPSLELAVIFSTV